MLTKQSIVAALGEQALALPRLINEALDRPDFDVAAYFPDLVNRDPPRPAVLDEAGE